MNVSEAIDLIAAELLVFDWEADRNGIFGLLMDDGVKLRLIPDGVARLSLERVIVEGVKNNPSLSDHLLLTFLQANFENAVILPGCTFYLSELDEIVYSEGQDISAFTEKDIEGMVKSFLGNAGKIAEQFSQLSSASSRLPTPAMG